MSNIKDFMSACLDKKPTTAYDSFSAEMENRVSATLTSREIEIANQIFNQESTKGTDND